MNREIQITQTGKQDMKKFKQTNCRVEQKVNRLKPKHVDVQTFVPQFIFGGIFFYQKRDERKNHFGENKLFMYGRHTFFFALRFAYCKSDKCQLQSCSGVAIAVAEQFQLLWTTIKSTETEIERFWKSFNWGLTCIANAYYLHGKKRYHSAIHFFSFLFVCSRFISAVTCSILWYVCAVRLNVYGYKSGSVYRSIYVARVRILFISYRIVPQQQLQQQQRRRRQRQHKQQHQHSTSNQER